MVGLLAGHDRVAPAVCPLQQPPPVRGQVVDDLGVNIFYTAPTAIRALIRAGDQWAKKYSRKSLRILGTVGEPINPEAWRWYHDVVGDGPLLRAGDADMDLDFDQLDLVQVQVAAKYLSGEVATWGEGDWDGGPGGYPGEPPEGNGFFDQRDIVAAMATGNYLQGP